MEAIKPDREIHGIAMTCKGRSHRSAGRRSSGLDSTLTYGTCSVSNSWMAWARPTAGERSWFPTSKKVGYLRLRKANDPPAPLTLEGRRRGTVLIGIARKDHQLHFFSDRRIHNRIERFEKVEHTQRQARFGIVAAIVGHIDVCVGKVEDAHGCL